MKQKKIFILLILILNISALIGCSSTKPSTLSDTNNFLDINVEDIEEVDLTEQIHPELRENLEEFGTGSLITEEMIPDIRKALSQMESETIQDDLPDSNVTVTQKTIPGLSGEPDVTIYIFQPLNTTSNMPGMIYIHGGGMVFGSVNEIKDTLIQYTTQLNCTIISPEYRLAPENPYPAGLNDCYAALLWFSDNATELNVNPDNIIVSGMSAGGGFAAALAIKARDENGPKIAAQILDSPALDYRSNTASAIETTDKRFWCRQENILVWKMYLGEQRSSEISAQASPALLEDFNGLPPAYISVGGADMFMDESIEYAQNLRQAGIFADLHIYSGVYHGAIGDYPNAEICQRMEQDKINAVKHFFEHGYF